MTDMQEIQVEIGSGNVFEDLEIENADELFSRSQIGYHVFKLVESRNLNAQQIAQTLDMTPTDVSHLMNGHFSRFPIDKLLECLRYLDQKVIISIQPHQKGEPYQEVSFVEKVVSKMQD